LQQLNVQGLMNVQGLAITAVQPNSTAARAGLVGANQGAGRGGIAGRGRGVRPGVIPFGDVITQINGEPIHNSADLFNVLNKSNPGDTVDITLWNNGTVRHVQVQTQ